MDGPLTELAAVLGVPVVRLRAAIPEELLPGSLVQALGRSRGLSAKALTASAPDLLRKIRRAFRLGAAAVSRASAAVGSRARSRGPEAKRSAALTSMLQRVSRYQSAGATNARLLSSGVASPRYSRAESASPVPSFSAGLPPRRLSSTLGAVDEMAAQNGKRLQHSSTSSSGATKSFVGARARSTGPRAGALNGVPNGAPKTREALPARGSKAKLDHQTAASAPAKPAARAAAAAAPPLSAELPTAPREARRSLPARLESASSAPQPGATAAEVTAAGPDAAPVPGPAGEDWHAERESMVATAMVMAAMCGARSPPSQFPSLWRFLIAAARSESCCFGGPTFRELLTLSRGPSIPRRRYVCRAVPTLELAAQQSAAAAAFAPVRALKWDFNSLVSAFRIMFAPRNMFTGERWLTRARTWRLVLLQKEDGCWEPSGGLAQAIASHRTRPRKKKEGGGGGGVKSPGMGTLAALATGDMDELDDLEDAVEAAEGQGAEDVERCPITGFSAAAIAWSMPEHLRLAAAQARRGGAPPQRCVGYGTPPEPGAGCSALPPGAGPADRHDVVHHADAAHAQKDGRVLPSAPV